jgi:flagellar assembly factor FliW
MEVKTKNSGTVDVPEAHLITFPEGLFGFEEYKEYALIDSEYKPFVWLQSLEKQNLAFLLIDPFIVCADYEIDVDDRSLENIGISSPLDVVVMAVVTIPSGGGPITANLQGPLIINKVNRQSMQAVLSDPRWTTKYDIVENLKKREEG